MSIYQLLFRSMLFAPALFLTSALVAGGEVQVRPATPKSLQGGKAIATVVAKTLFDNKEAEFFDVRSGVDFRQAHIPGAKGLSYAENSECATDFNPSVDQFELAMLPPDKGKTVVFYCDGPTGWKSYKAAVLAIEVGYRDVMWLREGFSGWQSAKYPVE